MIERIDIKNFQRLERFRIDFDPGTTAITGPSDSGKSSALRALRWLALNKPRGDGFIKDGEDKAAVRLKVDGHDIRRKRGKAENTYTIDGKLFKAFGADVPQQIADLLNLDDVNFQGQHDPVFWFSLSPGECAKQLNKIIDLEIIDQVMATIASRLRKAKAEREVTENRLTQAKEEKDNLDYVPRLEIDLKDLEDRQETIISQNAREAVLRGLVEKGMELRDSHRNAVRAAQCGSRATTWGAVGLELANKYRILEGLIGRITLAKDKVSVPIPHLCGLDCLYEKMGQSRGIAERLEELIERIRRQGDKGRETYNRLTEAKEELTEAMDGRCPICGSEYDGK